MAIPVVSSPPGSSQSLTAYDRTQGQVGMYAPSAPIFGLLQTTPSANRAYLMRFVPSRAMAVTKIAFATVVAAAANDEVCVGLYDTALARLGTSGVVTGKLNATAGVQTVDLTGTVNLTAGTAYYAAWSSGTQGGSAVQMIFASFIASGSAGLMGSAAGAYELGFQASAHPLPNPTTAAMGITGGPFLAVRES